MKVKNKIIAIVLIIVAILLLINVKVNAEIIEDGDWRYSYSEEDGIIIFKYLGTDKVVEVPKYINGKSVQTIGGNAFENCNNVEKIILPENVTQLWDNAFANCESLKILVVKTKTSVNIESGPDELFKGCSNELKVYLSEHCSNLISYLNNIGISYCTNVEGDYAYIHSEEDGTIITKYLGTDKVVEVPKYINEKSVQTIGGNAFANCNNIEKIILPESVTQLWDNAFANCESLKILVVKTKTSVDIESGPDELFKGCSDELIVYLSKHCTNLISYLNNIGINYCTNIDGEYAYINSGEDEITISKYLGTEKEVIVPEKLNGKTVTTIGERAFGECKNIERIVFPENINDIYESAFINCESLKIVIFKAKDGISIKPYNLFKGCSNELVVYLSENCTSFMDYLNEEGIGSFNQFSGDYAYLYSEGDTITLSKYLGTENEVIVPEKIDGKVFAKIGEKAFEGCRNIESIVLPESITDIRKSAFINCESLKTVRFNTKEIISIEPYDIFKGCSDELTVYLTKNNVSFIEYLYDEDIEYVLVNECSISHTPNNTVRENEKAATCLNEGSYDEVIYCSVCGEEISRTTKTVAKLNHKHIVASVITKATLKADGKIVNTKKCSECGTVEYTTTTPIYYPKTVSLKTTSYTYNGKVRKPSVVVKDSEGNTIISSNYNVTYSNKNSKNVGKYTVKITFKGIYKGTKELTYDIKPKGTKLKKLTNGSKSFTTIWKKQYTQTTGYQIKYSTDSEFKNGKTITIYSKGTSSRKIKGLKKNKKYYVKIRTFKTVKFNKKSIKIYSDWSSSKNVKTR